MNDQAVIDIQRHNSKISRILNKIGQKIQGSSQQIDLALYSCLKIQKIVKKYTQQMRNKLNQNQQVLFSNNDSNVNLTEEEDQLYQNALNIIEGFKTATKKLQKKVGILLRQQQISQRLQRAQYHTNMNVDQQYQVPIPQKRHKNFLSTKTKHPVSTYQHTSPFNHVVPSTKNKNKHSTSGGSKGKSQHKKQKIRVQDHINKQQSFNELSQNNQSKNISQLDQQIIELASQIKHIMKGQ